jgi:hypothetical protein
MGSLIWNWGPLMAGLALAAWGWLQWVGRFKAWADPGKKEVKGYYLGPDAAGNLTMGGCMSLLGLAVLLGTTPGALPATEDWTPMTAPVLWVLLTGAALLGAFYFYLLHWQPEWPNPAWYRAYQAQRREQEKAAKTKELLS